MKRLTVIFVMLAALLCLCACNQNRLSDSEVTVPSDAVSLTENVVDPVTCDHDWIEASCTALRTCSKCNFSVGTVAHVWEDPDSTIKTCKNCGEVTVDPEHYMPPKLNITIRFHYIRPDRDYEGWNLWVWDHAPVPSTDLEPPYPFEVVGDEAICTFYVNSGTDEVGYIVRYGEWEEKDIEEDQFIDLSGVLSGTVDFYVQSGEKGGDLVLPCGF